MWGVMEVDGRLCMGMRLSLFERCGGTCLV